MSRRVLVAGLGNVFFGDDGVGVEVALELAGRPVPEGVRVADFGIRALHLAYELLDGYDALVMVDAMPLDAPPGTLAVVRLPSAIDRDDDRAGGGSAVAVDAHGVSPESVLAIAAQIGATIGEAYVVGCQPETTAPALGLSDAVAAAIAPACDLVHELLDDLAAATTVSTPTGRS